MSPVGRERIGLGLLLVVAGLWFTWSGRPRLPLGRLPLDLHIERENLHLYFPLGTCLLISLLASLALWLFRRCPPP